jgi:hypothetical protein
MRVRNKWMGRRASRRKGVKITGFLQWVENLAFGPDKDHPLFACQRNKRWNSSMCEQGSKAVSSRRKAVPGIWWRMCLQQSDLLDDMVKLNGLTTVATSSSLARLSDLSTTEILDRRQARKKNTKLSNRNRDFLSQLTSFYGHLHLVFQIPLSKY